MRSLSRAITTGVVMLLIYSLAIVGLLFLAGFLGDRLDLRTAIGSGAAVPTMTEAGLGTLAVEGSAAISVPNTMAEAVFGVVTQDPNAGTAVTENGERTDTVIEAIIAAGAEPSSITTSQINLNQMGIDGERLFEMRNLVTVRVDDVALLDDILTAATGAGANEIQSVRLMPTQDAVDYDALVASASEDARARASVLAAAMGVEIVGIENVTSHAGGGPQPVGRMELAESVPVMAGASEQSLRVQVTYTVRLLDGN